MFPITFQMNNGPKSYQKPCSVPFKNRLNRNKLLATQPPFLKLTPEFSPPTKRMAVGNLPNAPSYCWSPLKLHHEPIKHSLYWSRSDSWKDLRNFNNPWTSSHTEPQVLRFFLFFPVCFLGGIQLYLTSAGGPGCLWNYFLNGRKQNKNGKHRRTWSTSSFATAEGGVFLKFGKDVPEETAAFQKKDR